MFRDQDPLTAPVDGRRDQAAKKVACPPDSVYHWHKIEPNAMKLSYLYVWIWSVASAY